MKPNHVILILLVALSTLLINSGCQEQAKVGEELKATPTGDKEMKTLVYDPNQPSPKMKFEKVSLDFGKVGPGTKSTGEFKFTNAGNEILKITKVGQCCGVVTKLEKREYAPGENGVLNITYNASVRIGKVMRQLVVHSNDKANPSTRLTIKAEVVAKIACDPEALKLMLNEENAGCGKLTISSLDGQPFAITAMRSTGNCITADFDPSVKATKFVLDLKVDMEKLEKNQKGSIDFNLTHPEGRIAYVRFDVVPKYTLNPQILIVFNAVPQKPITRKVWIFNNYQEDFEIESTSSKSNTIKVTNQNKVNRGYQLEVEITPPEQNNQLRFTDVLNIDIKGGEKKAITCNGYYLRSKTSTKAK
jgi:hypothetical protein